MMEHLLISLSYFVPAALVAALALRSSVTLGGIFSDLKKTAAGQQLGVPPLVAIYFRTTIRTLFVSGVLHYLALLGDAAVSRLQPSLFSARLLGYGSAVVLLVCGFALMVHGGADRQLKLQSQRMRIAQLVGGLLGICDAVWGIALVTWQGGIWTN